MKSIVFFETLEMQPSKCISQELAFEKKANTFNSINKNSLNLSLTWKKRFSSKMNLFVKIIIYKSQEN